MKINYLISHMANRRRVQSQTRLRCGSGKSYPERLSELGWATMELRRKYLCIIQLYKIIFGHNDIDCAKCLDFMGPTKTRRKHDFKVRPGAFRTYYFNFSFFNRYIQDWNSLPANVLHASSLNSFKSLLRKHLVV